MASNNIYDFAFVLDSYQCHKIIKPLDDILRCRICFEYFKNCMITKCSHNYCSLCIRRYMVYKAQCPTCFQDASEPELRNNRLLDEVLRIYLILRDDLQKELVEKNTVETTANKSDEPSQLDPKSIVISESLISCPKEAVKSPEIEPEKVTCPVCYKAILADCINIHLDSCLKKQDTEKKMLPKLVYHLMSEKDIKKKLKEQGLNVAGDRKTLIKRHKNFVTLFNANSDSLKPKPVEELIVELEAQELEERLNSIPVQQPQVSKKMNETTIDSENKTYVKKHESQFNALIQDVQLRDLGRVHVKPEPRDNISPDKLPDTSVPSASPEKESVTRVHIKTEPVDYPPITSPKTDSDVPLSYNEVDGLNSEEFGSNIIQLNLLRKRKKGRTGIGSPKRK